MVEQGNPGEKEGARESCLKEEKEGVRVEEVRRARDALRKASSKARRECCEEYLA